MLAASLLRRKDFSAWLGLRALSKADAFMEETVTTCRSSIRPEMPGNNGGYYRAKATSHYFYNAGVFEPSTYAI